MNGQSHVMVDGLSCAHAIFMCGSRFCRFQVIIACVLACSSVHADEGMWMPQQLPQIAGALQHAGFEADPAALASLTGPPLSAVVRVGGGTGAFVSGSGLLLTNHHVAYGVIQYHTNANNNLIDNGFIANHRADERPANPDFQVLVTTGFEEVTAQILHGTQSLTGRAYFDAVERASKHMVAECERGSAMRCSVLPFNGGAQFYRVTQLPLHDVRLVYAPPRAIGNYGDEIDNFMWPRHSGDFTLLRAYVGRNGEPAPYSADNVPYQPPAHLQIAIDGMREGDFAMLAGYPGVTYRHRSAAEFGHQVGQVLPRRIDLLDAMIQVLDEAGRNDADLRTRYAAQLQTLKNQRKRAAGELQGLIRSDAVRQREQDQRQMWAAWQDLYGATPAQAAQTAFETAIARTLASSERGQLLAEIAQRTQLLRAALLLARLQIEQRKPDPEREPGFQNRDQIQIEGFLHQVQRRYAPDAEKALLGLLLTRYQALPDELRLPEYDAVFGRTREALDAALNRLYAQTSLGNEQVRLASMAAIVNQRAPDDDPLLAAAAQLVEADLRMEDARKSSLGELLRLRPLYMQALTHWRQQQGRALSPDANGSLRVSFGRVEPLTPRDAVRYLPVTTVAGIVEKHTGQAPFDAPAPLLSAIAGGQFGRTLDPVLGTQPVNFMTNLDTTGGHSGSPVLNARGQLVGLNFDSNWESVSASWWYDPRSKRAIHVDMRYMHWLLARVYPAHGLLREMGLPVE